MILDPRALAAYIQRTVRNDIAEEVKNRNERQVTERRVFVGDVIVPVDDPGDTSATDEEKRLRLPEFPKVRLKDTPTGLCAICDEPLYTRFDPTNEKHYKEPGWGISERWPEKPLRTTTRWHTLPADFEGEDPDAVQTDPPKNETKITQRGKLTKVELKVQNSSESCRVMIGTGQSICSTCSREISKTPLAWEAAQAWMQTNDRAPGSYPERIQGIRRRTHRIPRYADLYDQERELRMNIAAYERTYRNDDPEPLPEPGEGMAGGRVFEIADSLPGTSPEIVHERIREAQVHFPGIPENLRQAEIDDFLRWLAKDTDEREDLRIETYTRKRVLRGLRGVLNPIPCEHCNGPIYDSGGARFCSDRCRQAEADLRRRASSTG